MCFFGMYAIEMQHYKIGIRFDDATGSLYLLLFSIISTNNNVTIKVLGI
jgi:hypothetical protein